ncbi:MAG: hypothetical protein QOJ15_10755 [Bradyrhizobium sp.]|nr:hypothetical protein [Bradyrhizobium sp.]
MGVDASNRNQQTRTNLAASDNSNRAGERRQFSFLVNCSPPSTIRTRCSQRNHDTDTVKPFLTRCGRGASPGSIAKPGAGPALCRASTSFAGHRTISSSWPGIAGRRTASLPLAYVPAIHVFCFHAQHRHARAWPGHPPSWPGLSHGCPVGFLWTGCMTWILLCFERFAHVRDMEGDPRHAASE